MSVYFLILYGLRHNLKEGCSRFIAFWNQLWREVQEFLPTTIFLKTFWNFGEKMLKTVLPLDFISLYTKNWSLRNPVCFTQNTKNITALYCKIRHLEVDGRPSKKIFFGQSALLMNATYIVFP